MMKIFRSRFGEKFIVAFIILITTLVVELQYIVGSLNTPDGYIYLGTVHWPSDYFYYLSQFAQSRYSFLSSTMLFTSEKLQPVLVGWQNVLTGKILMSLGFDVIMSYQIAVFVYLNLFLVLSYYLIKEIFPYRRKARLLAFFIFLTSTGLFKLLKGPEGWQLSYHTYWYNLGNFVSRFGPTPHHLIAYSLGTGGLLIFIKWFKEKSVSVRTVSTLMITGFLLSSISPVHWGLLLMVSFVTGCIFFLSGKMKWQKSFQSSFLFLVAGTPASLYVKYVFSTDPYKLSSVWEATQRVPISLYWLIAGSGLVIIYGAIGIYPYLRKITTARLLVIIFLAIASFFYISPVVSKLHLTNARFWPSYVYIVWAVLAVEGIFFLSDKIGRFKKVFLAIVLLIYTASIVPTYYAQYKEILTPRLNNGFFYIEKNVYKAIQKAEELSIRDDIFLVQWPFNESFPGLTGRKTVFGFELFTINYLEKMNDSFDIIDGKMSEEQLEKTLNKYGVDYLLMYSWNQYFKQFAFLKAVYSNPTITIYKVAI